MNPRYPTFARFLEALQRGDIDRSNVHLVAFTGSCHVKALQRVTPDDDEVLYEGETLETFLIDVGAALGIEAYIS